MSIFSLFVVFVGCIYMNFSQDCSYYSCPGEADGDCTSFESNCLGTQGCKWDAMDTCYASTSQEVECESDLNNWALDYIGKSTQFRYYSACNNKWFKIKMEDLTEYNSKNDQKTNNKQTSFASTNWDWSDPNGADVYYNNDPNYPAKKNSFKATLSNNAYFELTSVLYLKETEVIINNITNQSITVAKYGIKWSVIINNWQYINAGNYLRLCISMMDNNGNGAKNQDINNDNTFKDGVRWNVGNFYMDSPTTATCTSNSNSNTNTNTADINVLIENDGKNKQNKQNFCFKFDYCDGNIMLDPVISYDNITNNTNNNNNNNNNNGNAPKLIHGSISIAAVAVIIMFFIALF